MNDGIMNRLRYFGVLLFPASFLIHGRFNTKLAVIAYAVIAGVSITRAESCVLCLNPTYRCLASSYHERHLVVTSSASGRLGLQRKVSPHGLHYRQGFTESPSGRTAGTRACYSKVATMIIPGRTTEILSMDFVCVGVSNAVYSTVVEDN